MAGETHEDRYLPTLATAISNLRKELQEAQQQASQEQFRFEVRSVTLELQVVAVNKGEGQIGFSVPVLGFSAGIKPSLERTRTHTVKIELAVPSGTKVAYPTDEKLG